MYGLDEIKRFAFDWLRPHLEALTQEEESGRPDHLNTIAFTNWRWTARALQDLLLDVGYTTSPVLIDCLLQTLFAIDPRRGIDAALNLLDQEQEPRRTMARLFLASVPSRYQDVVDPERLRAVLEAKWIGTLNGIDDLFARFGDANPLVRMAAANITAQFAGPSALSGPFCRLADDSPLVVRSCFQAIGRRRIDKAKKIAAERLTLEGSNVLRMQVAADFLANSGPDGVETLLDSSNSNEQLVVAARAFVHWAPQAALDVFELWSQDSDRDRRMVAAEVLYELVAVEQRWPSPDASERIRRAQEIGIGLLKDSYEYVRCAALVLLAEIGWDHWDVWARDFLLDGEHPVRHTAIHLLDVKAGTHYWPNIPRLLEDPEECVRDRAFALIKRIGKNQSGMIESLRRMLDTPNTEARSLVIELLGEHGDAGDLAKITSFLHDTRWQVRRSALAAAARLAPEQTSELALAGLRDRDDDVAKSAIQLLEQCHSQDEVVEIVLRNLRRARDQGGPVLLQVIEQKAPDRLHQAVSMAVRSRSDPACERATGLMREHGITLAVAQLKEMLRNRNGGVRQTALRELDRTAPDTARLAARQMLRDKYGQVRQQAIEVLAAADDPLLVDDLLPLARDEDNEVRRLAIWALAGFDDPRVFGELLSSVNDVDASVRELAEAILDGTHGAVPSVSRFCSEYDETIWKHVVARVDRINRWAARIGWELLGKRVVVRNYRQGLGRTSRASKHNTVDIEVSDTPVTSGHPHGEDIMKGLALHEIGHHLCDIGVRGEKTMAGIARSERVGEIYDILRDERLERVLRSKRPETGIYFDRLASYAFAQNVRSVPLKHIAKLAGKTLDEARTEVQTGRLPGQCIPSDHRPAADRVALRDREMLAIPGLFPPHMAFLACLRCGFDPKIYPDAKVAEAIAVIPPNLKDLTHKDLLAVARRIGDLLGKSDRLKQDMKRLRQRILQHQAILRQFGQALDRMADTGLLPDWMRQGAPGIRVNQIVPSDGPRDEQTPAITRDRSQNRSRSKLIGGRGLNLGINPDFDRLEHEHSLSFDSRAHEQLVAPIRKHIRRLRSYLDRLGRREIEQYAARRGRRLDVAQARMAVLKGSPNILVHSLEVMAPSAYIGVLIDRSGSMGGDKIERAKEFGLLLAEAARGLRGINGHVNAFDDDTFYRLGDFRRNTIASLRAGGGNNDSGALAKAAGLALASQMRNKLLVMISDGSPTECTFESLRNLVSRLTREHRILCAQVAVQSLHDVAFPHYFDLSDYTLDVAVARFGNLLIRLTQGWR